MTYRIMLAVALLLAARCEVSYAADESASHAAVLEEAFDIAQRRDSQALLKHVDVNVRISHGMEDGKEYFIRWFEPENPSSPFWNDLITILATAPAGGDGADDRSSCYPTQAMEAVHGVGERFAESEFESLAFPLGSATGVWSEPSVDSQLVTRVGLDTFFVLGESPSHGWQHATILDSDLSGYVRDSDIRSATDYHLCFRIDDDDWMITTYIPFYD